MGDKTVSKRNRRLKTITPEPIKLPPQPSPGTEAATLCARCLQRPRHGLSSLCRECRQVKHFRDIG